MTELIVNGDYVISNETYKFEKTDNVNEVLQNAKLLLTARRGSFYPNKDFGSLIRAEELREPREEYALAYARQALDIMDGVFVKSASIEGNVINFRIFVNDGEGQVSIELENNL